MWTGVLTVFDNEIEDVKRVREIVHVMISQGFTEIVDRSNLREKLPFGERFFSRGEYKPTPVRLRQAFEKLGPSFIKLGQMLGQRPDLVPDEYIEELEKLEENVKHVESDKIKSVISESLGKSVENIFESFEDEPLATASIAQVHRAVFEGEEVAVKVMKPGVENKIRTDLRILGILVEEAETAFGTVEKYHVKEVFEQFREWTLKEINFIKEAENMELVDSNFSSNRDVYIPDVYWKATSEKVLTTEFIDGARLKPGELEEKGIDREFIAETVVKTVLQMVLRDGVFHGDPHPSNMRVDSKERLVMFDFGIVGRLSKEIRRELSIFFLHALNQDMDALMDSLRNIASFNDDVNVEKFKSEIEEIFMKSPETKLENSSFSRDFLKMVRTSARHGIFFPTKLVSGGKSLFQAEGLGLKIYPGFQPYQTVKSEVQRILVGQNSPMDIGRSLMINLVENRELIDKAPKNILEMIQNFKDLNKLSLEGPINFSSKDIAIAIFGSVMLLSGSLTVALSPDFYMRVLGLAEIIGGVVIGFFVVSE